MAPRSLIIRSTIQALVLASISNILAQLLTAYRSSRPLHIDPLPLLRYLFFTLLSAPPNIAWQSFLERRFPAYPLPSRRLSKRNTAAKFLLDQSLGAVLNTWAFIAGMDLLRGETSGAAIVAHLRRDTGPIIRAGQKVWPLVSVVSFTLVPLEWRTALGGMVGIGWGVWLCLIEGGKA